MGRVNVGVLGFKISMRGGFGLESMATIAEWLLVCLGQFLRLGICNSVCPLSFGWCFY